MKDVGNVAYSPSKLFSVAMYNGIYYTGYL